jgi:hypothetical protein
LLASALVFFVWGVKDMSAESKDLVSKLISFEDAGILCGGLSASTFRCRKAGTHLLTHVPWGRRVMLIREEVEKLIEEKIARAQSEEIQRRKNFRVLTGGR